MCCIFRLGGGGLDGRGGGQACLSHSSRLVLQGGDGSDCLLAICSSICCQQKSLRAAKLCSRNNRAIDRTTNSNGSEQAGERRSRLPSTATGDGRENAENGLIVLE